MSSQQLLIEFTQTAQQLYQHYKVNAPDVRDFAENIKTVIELGHKAHEVGKELNEKHKEHIERLVKEHPLSPENTPDNAMLGATEKDIKSTAAQKAAADKSRQDLSNLLKQVETKFNQMGLDLQKQETLQKEFTKLRDLQEKMLNIERQRQIDQQAIDRAARAGRDWSPSL